MPKARHVQESVTIQRSSETVFAFLADLENDKKWRPSVLEMARVSGDGVGARYRQVIRGPRGRRIPADIEITELQPDRLIGFRTLAGPVRPEGRYELTPSGAGTSVKFSLRAELSGPQRLLSRPVGKAMQSEVGALANLRRVLEKE